MTILAELHQDHINLDKLLVLLRSKADRLKRGQQQNFNLVGDVIAYISSYADAFHHPREDQIYEYFMGRSPQLDELLQQCEQEHLVLKQSSVQLQNAIDGILYDAVMPVNELAELLQKFVLCQSNHLNLEEGEIFPKLTAVADEKDWLYLTEQLPSREDPLFGSRLAEEFTDLYKELILDLNAA